MGIAFAQEPAQTSAPPARTWTSTNGESVEARFVKLEEGKVFLKRTDGTPVSIGLDSLSAPDQEVVGKLAGDPDKPVVPRLSTVGLFKGEGGILSDDEIAALVTESTDEKSGDQLVFTAFFEKKRMTDDNEIRKYSKSGRVPFRVAAKLAETIKGQKKRVTGTMCHFYVLDADGKQIVKRTVAVESMCSATMDWEGGYYGEVPKEGQYTAIIWVSFSKVMFGRKITISL